MRIEENVSFKALTTFKVGGVVRYVCTVESELELSSAVDFANERGLPLIPFGGGSNMLGVDGTLEAVFVRIGMCSMTLDEAHALLTVDAGAQWHDVVVVASERHWWGIENLSSIPGTMGGAVVQNIGAYGAVLASTLVAVRAFDTHSQSIVAFDRSDCQFGYRTSVFKRTQDRYIILSATLALTRERQPNIAYKDLHNVFGSRALATAVDVRDAVADIRAAKFPPLAEFGTAGSFFLNTIVSVDEAARLQVQYPTMPVFTLPEGGIKIPLGWFFEHVLNLKGHRDGFAEVWRNQALVIVAHDGASADEIKKFAEKIIARAKDELQIIIYPEVRLL